MKNTSQLGVFVASVWFWFSFISFILLLAVSFFVGQIFTDFFFLKIMSVSWASCQQLLNLLKYSEYDLKNNILGLEIWLRG